MLIKSEEHMKGTMFANASIVEVLDEVMKQYRDIFNGDPGRFIKEFPKEEFWRFFIDGHLQRKEGWKKFEEREPKYLFGVFSACAIMFDLSENLSIDLMIGLHELAMG